MEKIKAPGLRWIRPDYPCWVPLPRDVKSGFRPKTIPLVHVRENPTQLVALCNKYQAELELWRTGYERDTSIFDGKISTLLKRYENDEDSPYRALRPSSLVPYRFYLPKLLEHIGDRSVEIATGVDLIKWHKVWSADGKYLAASAMMRAVLAAAVSYGVMLRLDGCADFLAVIKETNKKIPQPRRREFVVTAEQVIAARKSAHEHGRPGWALAYALAFETTLRLWDVTGQWVPLDSPGVSDVTTRRYKWFGAKWDCIDSDLVLRYVPSKTSGKTGKSVTYPLAMAPMVMEELEHWPEDKRVGPIIVWKRGLPPLVDKFRDGWRVDAAAAGISKDVWARDLRASGITEARAGDANLDDAAMVAGHSSKRTTAAVYDRANLQAAERFADARLKERKKSK
jgi:integrase